MNKDLFDRKQELNELTERISESGAAFFFVRGRRRVGKSWILKELTRKSSHIFYFMGEFDSKSASTRSNFVQAWESFSKRSSLSQLRPSVLTWGVIFNDITDHVQQTNDDLVLVFDEVQWLAREGSGFLSQLKQVWLDWEMTAKIKVILCGSSNRFFIEKTGGEEKIIRGLKTASDFVVQPIDFAQCVKTKFKLWKKEEAAIAYMMTGGIPYYLAQIDSKLGFVAAINQAFFTRRGVFLGEVDEILNLDFNKKAIRSVKAILRAIHPSGVTQIAIQKKSRIPASTVNEVLAKLESYGLILQQVMANEKPKGNRAGVRYIINDFFLNTYFHLLLPLKNKIEANDKRLLFGELCLRSSKGYYIENFTGYMFEHMVKYVIESRQMKLRIFSKLQLADEDFEVIQYSTQIGQIDLIIEHHTDRISRAIEVKWISEEIFNPEALLIQLADKEYPLAKRFTRRNYLVIGLASPLKRNGPQNQEVIITLDDLSEY